MLTVERVMLFAWWRAAFSALRNSKNVEQGGCENNLIGDDHTIDNNTSKCDNSDNKDDNDIRNGNILIIAIIKTKAIVRSRKNNNDKD